MLFRKNTKAREIEGWFHPVAQTIISSLDEFQSNNSITGDIVEIGLWDGKSFVFLNTILKPHEKAIGFDIDIRENLIKNISSFPPETCITKRADSTKLSAADIVNISKQPVRMFHVDGHHTLTNATSDLTLAFAATDKAGIVMLDDYLSPTLPGVTEAAFSCFYDKKTNGFVPLALGGMKLFYCHEDFVIPYQSHLLRMEMKTQVKPEPVGDLMGSRPLCYHFHF